jgi:hypothetical protein
MESWDKVQGCFNEYSGEHGPYCGLHYNGHEGVLTKSHYHEGDGEKIGRLTLFGKVVIEAGHHTDEGWFF